MADEVADRVPVLSAKQSLAHGVSPRALLTKLLNHNLIRDVCLAETDR